MNTFGLETIEARRVVSVGNHHRPRGAACVNAGLLTACCLVAIMSLASRQARADESGVSFWLPGQQGSFAAVQLDTGWTVPFVYYHTSVSADASKSFPVGGQVMTGMNARADLVIAAPTYVFSSPVAGAQAAVGVTALLGRMNVGVEATLSGPFGSAVSGAQSDSLTGVGDLYPTASLKWQNDKHHSMVYGMAGVPVGAYQKGRLANIGTNHWSADAGGGYTYLDETKGHEFSAVLGFTYNLENPDTHYQNGVDAHLDWAASQFLSRQWHIGLVGYVYQQLTGDSGSGAKLGDFKSQVSALGPQVGYFFPVGGHRWYANFKGYSEYDAKNRPEGWSLWLTLAIPLGSEMN